MSSFPCAPNPGRPDGGRSVPTPDDEPGARDHLGLIVRPIGRSHRCSHEREGMKNLLAFCMVALGNFVTGLANLVYAGEAIAFGSFGVASLHIAVGIAGLLMAVSLASDVRRILRQKPSPFPQRRR